MARKFISIQSDDMGPDVLELHKDGEGREKVTVTPATTYFEAGEPVATLECDGVYYTFTDADGGTSITLDPLQLSYLMQMAYLLSKKSNLCNAPEIYEIKDKV